MEIDLLFKLMFKLLSVASMKPEDLYEKTDPDKLNGETGCKFKHETRAIGFKNDFELI